MLREMTAKRKSDQPDDEWIQKEPRVRKSVSTYNQEWQQRGWRFGWGLPPYRRPKPEPKRDQS